MSWIDYNHSFKKSLKFTCGICISKHFTHSTLVQIPPKHSSILYILADVNSHSVFPFVAFSKGVSTSRTPLWIHQCISTTILMEFKMALYRSPKIRLARYFFCIFFIVLGIGENRHARTVSIM